MQSMASNMVSNMRRQDDRESGVYVLRLKEKGCNGRPCFYVGKTSNKKSRIEQHIRGGNQCASWVREHGGVEGVEEPITTRESLCSWEQKETIERIMIHGFDNVRGWEWTSCRPFGRNDYVSFKVTAMGSGDLCRKCGNPGHFASNCNEKKASWLEECEVGADEFVRSPMSGKKRCREILGCRRCGRTSHTERTCWAKSDVDGNPLGREIEFGSDSGSDSGSDFGSDFGSGSGSDFGSDYESDSE